MITCVISLPEAKIRRQAISEQLRVAGLPFPKLSTAWLGKLLLHHLFMKQHLSSSWRVLVAILGWRHRMHPLTQASTGNLPCDIADHHIDSRGGCGGARWHQGSSLCHPERNARRLGILKVGGIGGVRGKLLCETSHGKIVNAAATSVCSHAYLVSRLGAALRLRAMLPVKFRTTFIFATSIDIVQKRMKLCQHSSNKPISLVRCFPRARRRRSIISVPESIVLSSLETYHKICRYRYLLATFGVRAAMAPSMMTRHR